MEQNKERYKIEKIEELDNLINAYGNHIPKLTLSMISTTVASAALAINAATFITFFGYNSVDLVVGGIAGALALTGTAFDAYLVYEVAKTIKDRKGLIHKRNELENENIKHNRGGK